MGLSTWASHASPDIAGALHELQKLRQVRHGVEIPSPVVLGTKADYHAACEQAGHPGHLADDIARALIRSVQIAGLRSIQQSVNPTRVVQYLRDPRMRGYARNDHRGPTDVPIVVQAGGRRYIHDGHTRITAAMLKDERAIDARFVDLDGS
jgi:hypothetical protein